MGCLQRLVETYDACANVEQFAANPLPPVAHTPQQAHLEVVLDAKGNFQRARILQKEETLVPATEDSANRVGTKPPPHPLCDKVQYVASDYPTYGGEKPSFHREYLELLGAWCSSPFTHPKAQAVLDYVHRGNVVADLIREQLLWLDESGKLLTAWPTDTPAPDIFRMIAKTDGVQDQGNAFIRWVVESSGDREPAVWRDPGLQLAWLQFYATLMQKTGLCMVTGKTDAALASSHPKRLRHPGDGAKLISSNDKSGFTFRGRFTDDTGDQACGVSYEASQKSHLALRWLIGRQAFRNGDQVIVAWSVAGEPIPDPLADTFSLLGLEPETSNQVYSGDAGQAHALALKAKIAGYRTHLPPCTRIIVLAMDAATPGRMAMTFYRELGGGEFLDRVEAWHTQLAWRQNFGAERKFIGAPAPRDIAEAAYGPRIDAGLRTATVERLLPCVIDRQRLPRQLVELTIRRATRRVGLEPWDWERTLGVACSLYNAFQQQQGQRSYTMALEPDRTSRDYLFGRLLATAEHLEQRALYYAGERRETHAAKLMQRFANHPCATWRQIEVALVPAKSRMRSRSPGYLHKLEKEIDHIVSLFDAGDFTADRKLSGEFLLGYHCQRASLHEPKPADTGTDASNPTIMEESE